MDVFFGYVEVDGVVVVFFVVFFVEFLDGYLVGSFDGMFGFFE